MVYLRMIQLVAPYLAIGFACGLAGLMARSGASRFIQFCVVLIIIIGAFGGILTFWQSTLTVYQLNSQPGLIHAGEYIGNYTNTTTLAFYGWGWAMEYYGHSKVYADTIQGLNYSAILPMDSFFRSYPVNCSYLSSLHVKPDFILASPQLAKFGLFYNASPYSVAKYPAALSQCGYSLAYQNMNFSVYKKD